MTHLTHGSITRTIYAPLTDAALAKETADLAHRAQQVNFDIQAFYAQQQARSDAAGMREERASSRFGRER